MSPQQVLTFSFLLLIILGTVLLSLPFSVKGGRIGLIDAFFTATSAVCVTGLVVVDTGSYFTSFGHWVILFLIQVGGLGIVTFSVLFYSMLGFKVRIRDRLAVQSSFSTSSREDIIVLLKSIFLYTVVIEGIGVLLLTLAGLRTFPFGQALRYGLFHSISAFCNAGFSLFWDSFSHWSQDWLVNLTLWGLIISGGMGFIALRDIVQGLSNKGAASRLRTKLSLHTKLVLTSSAVLVVGGTITIMALESANTLRDFGMSGKFLAASFQSITARTAGFNTIDIFSLTNSTLFILLVLMFIGASPGSCGGGVKNINIAILVILAFNRFRGRETCEVFKRTIPEEAIYRALTIILVSVAVVIIMASLLMMSEMGHISHSETRGEFLEYLFETVSAFGTVGLSMGATSKLSVVGKLIVIITMFIGRVGPLNLAYTLAKRTPSKKFKYAEEKIFIG